MSIERIGIGSSIVGALTMAVYGLGMAHYTQSDAIFLDGAFNFLSAFLSIGSLILSYFVNRSYTDNHPIGFYAYESFMIFIKGLFILGLVVMAIYSNFIVLLSGGRDTDVEGMLWYGFPALVVNILTWSACYLTYKKSPTGLLAAEYEGWKINTAITAVIAFSLLGVLQLRGTSFQWLERYIDQILVIILCILTIADPIRMVVSSFKEIMLRATNSEYKQEIEFQLNQAEEFTNNFVLKWILVLKVGRGSFVTLDLVCLNQQMKLTEYISLKEKLENKIKQTYHNIDISINILPE
ncbi:MAG: cation transporter [Brevinema sp.]